MIASVFMPAGSELDLDAPEQVGPGAAVCYVEEESGETHWMIIEDESEPVPTVSRAEYPADHPLARTMQSKRVGDKFFFPPQSVAPKQHTIKEIRTKMVYRAQESVEGWQKRFPDRPFIETFKLPDVDLSTAI